MATASSEEFLAAFADGDFERASKLIHQVAPLNPFAAHPLLREFVDRNNGHCYKPHHLRIADLLIPRDVRSFRDTVLADELSAVQRHLRKHPAIVHAEFTGCRGIAQAIHAWQSVAVAEVLLDAGADIDVLTTRPRERERWQ